MNKTQQLLQTIIEAIKDKNGNNIISLDFTKSDTGISDYFVICDAQSNVQVDAITKSVFELTQKIMNDKPSYIEGTQNSEWVLMDFTDVVVHIFQSEFRDFYKLEELWADAEFTKHQS